MRVFASIAGFCLSFASGCGGGEDPAGRADAGYDCSQDERGETYVAGMSKEGAGGYQIALVDALPSPPDRKDNRWTVAVTAPGGAPATDVKVEPLLCMPDHIHGTPIPATVTDLGDGQFQIDPLNLYMAGLWEVTLVVRAPDDVEELPPACQEVAPALQLDQVKFRFCVDG